MAKKTKPATKSAGPLARQVARVLREAGPAMAELLRGGTGPAADTLSTVGDHGEPAERASSAHALYVEAVNQVSAFCEILTELPELGPLTEIIGRAEDEYVPGWPPMSPISVSHFNTWALFDAAVGRDRETIGTIVLSFVRDLTPGTPLLRALELLTTSRLGLLAHEGADGEFAVLREIPTGARRRVLLTNGHAGSKGEVWLARLLPPTHPSLDAHICFTSPYVIVAPGEDAWRAYFDRNLKGVGASDRAIVHERLMKYGKEPNYWNEYIFEAYANHTDHAIFLRGLPDVAESRPHSSRFDPTFPLTPPLGNA